MSEKSSNFAKSNISDMNRVLQKLFGFDSATMKVRTEVQAGITTFLTMAYILAVNPFIFSALNDPEVTPGAVFTATVLAALLGTLIMAMMAKKPLGLAPGMGLNAFFVYTVCLELGYSWRMALTAVLLEGILFIILSVTSVREKIANTIPANIKYAITAGIGIYLAFIGLQNSGIVVDEPSTLVTLNSLMTPTSLLFIFGLFLTGILVTLKIKGALLIGLLVSTLMGIPLGLVHLDGFMQMPDSIAPIAFQFQWQNILTWDMVAIVFTFLFLDLFDTIGTVVGISVVSGNVDKDGKVDGAGNILLADAIATTVGACLGTSTTTTYLESASGIKAGGRSGLTAFIIAIGFAVALFFSPIFLAIPSQATGAVLVVVGAMMISQIAKIDWEDMSEAIPAFLTIIFMPFSYNISEGIMIGMVSYVLINGVYGLFHRELLNKVSPLMWVLAVIFIARYIIRG